MQKTKRPKWRGTPEETRDQLRVLSEAEPTLVEAQAFVGGYVEMVTLESGDQLLVNEDGLSLNLPVNPLASLLANRVIVGPALILRGTARWG